MNIAIYELSLRHSFLVLPEDGTPPEGLNTTTARPFKRLKLTPGESRVGMDVDEVLRDLKLQGWAVVGAAIVVETK